MSYIQLCKLFRMCVDANEKDLAKAIKKQMIEYEKSIAVYHSPKGNYP